MANDINMWEDLEEMDKRTTEYRVLFDCYNFAFIENDIETANKYKEVFINTFGYWVNYY